MPEFDEDRGEVIKRARDSGVTNIVTIGISPESNQRAVEIAEQYPNVWASIGIHPQEINGIQKMDIENLVDLAKNPRVVAIGELGLDYYRDRSPHEDQVRVLKWQLEAAKKAGLPVIVHCRQAQEDMIPILSEWCDSYKMPDNRPYGVLHCFSADNNVAEIYMKMGFYISLGAYIGYPSSAGLRSVIKNIPLNKLVLETDCPFLPPQKYRGKRNEPAYTLITLEVLAEIKQMAIDEISGQTTRNAINLFNLHNISYG
jgi:TatD DNase family protein